MAFTSLAHHMDIGWLRERGAMARIRASASLSLRGHIKSREAFLGLVDPLPSFVKYCIMGLYMVVVV